MEKIYVQTVDFDALEFQSNCAGQKNRLSGSRPWLLADGKSDGQSWEGPVAEPGLKRLP
jgi:hypothetical protein